MGGGERGFLLPSQANALALVLCLQRGYKIWGSVRALSFFCVFSLRSYISKSPRGDCGSASRREIFFGVFLKLLFI